MYHKKIYVSLFLLASIVLAQGSIPFEISKQFAVPLENNQLIWNSDKTLNNLLIDRSSRNFKNKFEKLSYEVLPEDSSYVKSKFIYEFGDYGFDKLRVGVKKNSLKRLNTPKKETIIINKMNFWQLFEEFNHIDMINDGGKKTISL